MCWVTPGTTPRKYSRNYSRPRSSRWLATRVKLATATIASIPPSRRMVPPFPESPLVRARRLPSEERVRYPSSVSSARRRTSRRVRPGNPCCPRQLAQEGSAPVRPGMIPRPKDVWSRFRVTSMSQASHRRVFGPAGRTVGSIRPWRPTTSSTTCRSPGGSRGASVCGPRASRSGRSRSVRSKSRTKRRAPSPRSYSRSSAAFDQMMAASGAVGAPKNTLPMRTTRARLVRR